MSESDDWCKLDELKTDLASYKQLGRLVWVLSKLKFIPLDQSQMMIAWRKRFRL